MKSYSFCILFFCVFLLGVGCSHQQKYYKDLCYVQPPKWVLETDNDGFSAVGISDKNLRLPEKESFAEQNGIENLKLNLLVKFEAFLFDRKDDNGNEMNFSKKKMIIDKLKHMAENVLDYEFLSRVSRKDEIWQSLNSDSLYIKVVVDKKQIANRLLPSIEKMQNKYYYDSEILFFLLGVKKGLMYGNFDYGNSKNSKQKNTNEDKNISQQNEEKKQNNEDMNQSIIEAIRVAEEQYEQSKDVEENED